jgi:hypothetical protein
MQRAINLMAYDSHPEAEAQIRLAVNAKRDAPLRPTAAVTPTVVPQQPASRGRH